ncbi:MAG: ATP-binding cassette domain-containing protein [Varibaculum sp.]
MGENGAGKSTLMKIIGGIHKANRGTITFKGQPYQPDGPADAQSKGVSLIHQSSIWCRTSQWPRTFSSGMNRWARQACSSSEEQAAAKADELLKSIGVTFSSKVLVRDLPVASQQMVEIAGRFLLSSSFW